MSLNLKNFKLILICLVCFFLFSSLLFAGNIRTVHINQAKMGTVYLAMGRSTVLNFDSPPKKIISGNANYFNIEFTGHDVTIQPLGTVESNVFIYTEHNRYGLILKAGHSKRYDDLVYVKWYVPRIKKKRIPLNYPVTERNGKFRARLLNVEHEEKRNLYLVDLEVTNLSKNKIALDKNSIWVTRNNRLLPVLEKVYAKKSLSIGEASRVRLIVRLQTKRGFTTHFKFGKTRRKFIVRRDFL